MQRLLSGIKPTGELTLGNYIGAINQFIKLQDNYENFIFIADLHALTEYIDPNELRDNKEKLVALYLACGLDYKKNNIFFQSDNLYHTNLSWILECNVGIGQLSRMTQYKDRLKKLDNQANISCGLFTYPVLMASDILLYDADVIPVGVDQKQHVELARDLAERFNSRYGTTFKLPTPIILEQGAKIYDLQNPTKKMSKSTEAKKGCICLLDEIDDIKKKIMQAVTDNDNKIYYDPINKPGISNLMTIYSVLANKKIEDVSNMFENSNYGEFKKAVSEIVCTKIIEIQTKFKLYYNSDITKKILADGANLTSLLAKNKLEAVYRKIGLK